MKCSKCGSEFDGTFCPMCGNEAKNDEQNVNVGVNNYTVNQEYMGTYTEPVKKKPFYKKPWFFGVLAAVAVVIIIIIAVNVGGRSEWMYFDKKIEWSEIKLHDIIPEPQSREGDIISNSKDFLVVEAKNISQRQYNEYVKKCEKKGFTKDEYFGYSKDGWHLLISYFDEDKELNVWLSVNKEKKSSTQKPTETTTQKPTETTTQKPTETTTQKPVETTAPASNPPASSSGIRSDFKAAMDKYEAFINEYVSFMARYNANPNDPNLLTDYLNYLGKYSSMVASFDSWSGSDLNSEELNYYLEVQTRVNQKLLGV